MSRNFDRSAEARIREWLAAAPDRGPDRALEDTIDRLRATSQPRMLELRLSLPVAAVLGLAMLLGAAGVLIGTRPATPVASPSASADAGGSCAVEIVVGGSWPILVGRGFPPDADIVLDVDLANGTSGRATVNERRELHTDAEGRFGFTMFATQDNVGRNLLTASAGGCTASTEMVVTADQLPARCPDETGEPVEVAAGAAYRAAVAADEPLHWWHLDEASGPSAADAAGGADGTWVGTPTGVGTGALRALFLDGNGSYIDVPRITVDAFTLEAWVYLCDAVDNSDAIVGNGLAGPSVNFFDERLRLFTGSEDIVIATTRVTLGTWQHWAVTRDATGTRIYRNGVLDASGGPWIEEMVIDEIGRGDAGNLRGALDEVALYGRALTAEELRAHADAR